MSDTRRLVVTTMTHEAVSNQVRIDTDADLGGPIGISGPLFHVYALSRLEVHRSQERSTSWGLATTGSDTLEPTPERRRSRIDFVGTAVLSGHVGLQDRACMA
jgi:hypothetical protein